MMVINGRMAAHWAERQAGFRWPWLMRNLFMSVLISWAILHGMRAVVDRMCSPFCFLHRASIPRHGAMECLGQQIADLFECSRCLVATVPENGGRPRSRYASVTLPVAWRNQPSHASRAGWSAVVPISADPGR